MKLKIKYCLVLLAVMAFGCKKPYTPPAITSPGSYLVVEGVINSGTDSTFIKLSKSVNISGKSVNNPVLGATVSVQGDQSVTYPLSETGNGYYACAGLNLDAAHKYRINITTAGKQYQSDYEAVDLNPPIDSVGYVVQGNGIQIYANTHDATSSTKYFRWDYTEAWQFHAEYESDYITNGQAIVARTTAQQIYDCFNKDTSSTIVLGSSAKLSQNIIYQNPITNILSTSEKIETKYTINVKQYALSAEAFTFWTNIKKNTEQLGSIFDAEPSDIPGNIHCITNLNEPVIGYISVGLVQQKRIFITKTQLPAVWQPTYPYSCEQDSLLYCYTKACINEVAAQLIPLNSMYNPTSVITKNGLILGYMGSSIECTDCTIRGSITAPSFWK